MRTSRGKIACKAIAGIVFLALVNALLCFALVPYGSKSQVIWDDYAATAEAGEPVDTVFVGTSFAHHALDPAAFDAVTGGVSFNLASPNQTLEESLVAVQTACADFPVERVVLAVSASELHRSGGGNPASTFLSERSRAVGFVETAATVLHGFANPGALSGSTSLNWIFPWVQSYVGPNPSAVLQNVRARMGGMPLAEAATMQDAAWTYRGQGFGAYDHVFNPDTEFGLYFTEAEASGDVADIDPDRAATLQRFCDYCAQEGVELVVVSIPMPAHNIDYYGDGYYALQEQVAALLAERGVPYFDFNMAAPAVFENNLGYYFDYAHMNADGATAFSTALARFLGDRAQGVDVDGMFLSRGEFEAAQTGIDGLMAQAVATDGGVHVSCEALAGPGVQAEYQVLVLGPDGSWEVARDYAAEGECDFTPASHGTVHIRVNARAAGSADEWQRYREVSTIW